MTKDFINQQLENINKLRAQTETLHETFNLTLSQTLKNAPDQDKEKIIKVQQLSGEAIELAKQGKMDKVKELTDQLKKEYSNER